MENFENSLRIDKVVTMSLVYYFLGHSIQLLLLVHTRRWRR